MNHLFIFSYEKAFILTNKLIKRQLSPSLSKRLSSTNKLESLCIFIYLKIIHKKNSFYFFQAHYILPICAWFISSGCLFLGQKDYIKFWTESA